MGHLKVFCHFWAFWLLFYGRNGGYLSSIEVMEAINGCSEASWNEEDDDDMATSQVTSMSISRQLSRPYTFVGHAQVTYDFCGLRPPLCPMMTWGTRRIHDRRYFAGLMILCYLLLASWGIDDPHDLVLRLGGSMILATSF